MSWLLLPPLFIKSSGKTDNAAYIKGLAKFLQIFKLKRSGFAENRDCGLFAIPTN
jgi:hypothetical protein